MSRQLFSFSDIVVVNGIICKYGVIYNFIEPQDGVRMADDEELEIYRVAQLK
jgi:hypothetical protein